MSGSLDLLITTGEVWAWQFTWRDSQGDPIPFSDPTMNIRRELNTKGELLARLDQSGAYEGKMTIPSPGVLKIEMTASQTNKLKSGFGFWDIYVTVYGNRCRLIFGTVEIAAHVTDLSS